MDKNERKNPDLTKEEINKEFLKLAPDAMDALKDIIIDPEINPIARVQAIALVLDRGLGKPEENIRIQHMEDSMEEAQERLEAIFAQARRKEYKFTLKKIYTQN